MAIREITTVPENGARTTRRALIAGALSVAACVPVGALANAARPAPADMEGMAIMHLNGRCLLVDLHRIPEPGGEAVVMVDQGRGNAPILDVFPVAPLVPEEPWRTFGDRTVCSAPRVGAQLIEGACLGAVIEGGGSYA